MQPAIDDQAVDFKSVSPPLPRAMPVSGKIAGGPKELGIRDHLVKLT
jgi:hypothetical protein